MTVGPTTGFATGSPFPSMTRGGGLSGSVPASSTTASRSTSTPRKPRCSGRAANSTGSGAPEARDALQRDCWWWRATWTLWRWRSRASTTGWRRWVPPRPKRTSNACFVSSTTSCSASTATRPAGVRRGARWKSTLPSMKSGHRTQFLFLPEGEDPDSLVRSEGRLAFERRLDDAVPLSRFLFNHLTAGVDLSTPEGGARFIDHLRPLINRTPNSPYRHQLLLQMGESYSSRVPAGPYRRQIERWFDELSRDDSPTGLVQLGGRVRAHAERVQGSESPATRAVRMLVHVPSLATDAGGHRAVAHRGRCRR